MISPLSIFSYKDCSVYFRPATVDESVLAHSFDNDIFYSGIPEYKGGRDSIVIDVGGHIGTFSIYSLIAGKAGQVISLEPNRESFDILSRNILENGMSNRIKALQYALSDTDGMVKLFLDSENWGHSLTNSTLKNFEEVPSITLPSLIALQKIEKCDLIKFNCEGAEFQIILSLDSITLKKIKMMLVLFHEDMVNNGNRAVLINFLRAHGFLIRTDKEGSHRGWIIAKNKDHYSSFSHQLMQTRKWVEVRLNYVMRRMQGALVETGLWVNAKKILERAIEQK